MNEGDDNLLQSLNQDLSSCSFGWWLMAGAGLF
jgi:hypothetical protein